MIASPQRVHVQLDRVDVGVAQLRGGHPHAVIEVEGITLHLQAEERQETILAAFAELLNALQQPIQLLVRVLPVDLDAYLAELERRAPPRFADAAREHAAYLRALAERRTLEERHYYVVIPGPPGAPPRRRAARAAWERAVARHLDARCEAMLGHLQRCELGARRLGNKELVQLYHACWCGDLARRQRVGQELGRYTTLTIGRDDRHSNGKHLEGNHA